MKKSCLFFSLILVVGFPQFACASKWTEETAREEAFRNAQGQINISDYPSQDPNFEENQRALQNNEKRVDDRFITANPEPPIGYVVSKIDAKGHALITYFYGADGRLITVRLFSAPDYPRSAYIYCIESECADAEKKYKAGELLSVSFHVSDREVFYFGPDGHLNAHLKD